MQKVLLGIQARSNSTRLPGKIYLPFGKTTVLKYLYNRMKVISVEGFEITVKILGVFSDEKLKRYCKNHSLKATFVQCDESDLLERYYVASKGYDSVVRVTSDCPLVSEQWVTNTIKALAQADYVTNTSPRSVIDGDDVQAIKVRALEFYRTYLSNKEEHLFYNLENNCETFLRFSKSFKAQSLIDMSAVILNPFHAANKTSIDTKDEYERIRKLV